MKSNNGKNRFLVLIVTFLSVAAVGFFWWQTNISAVDSSDNKPITFQVKSGEGVRVIAANLKNDNLIKSPTAFFIIVKIIGTERNIQAGDFRLNKTMNAYIVAQELTHGISDIWVTTPEGWRDEEIANRLAKDLDIPETEFNRAATEGYMFPDTYSISRDATAGAVAEIFLNNFNQKVTGTMRSDLRRENLTLPQVITLASIVEREGRTSTDRPIIAGILLKRLKAGWPLQTDATIQFALGYQSGEKSWWKKELTDNDKKINSPYNTYLNTGLPPGPICNPGLESIKAVIYPQTTDYWFYIHDSSGVAHYAKTIEEHEVNITKFL